MPAKRNVAAPSLAEQLQAIPIHNRGAYVERDSEAGVTLTVPLVYPALVRPLAKAMRLRQRRSYELDGVGHQVHRRIDGETTVGQLIDWCATEHRLSFHEARVLIMKYLQMLMERGLIVVGGKVDGLAIEPGKSQPP
jgi:hypothetical protein